MLLSHDLETVLLAVFLVGLTATTPLLELLPRHSLPLSFSAWFTSHDVLGVAPVHELETIGFPILLALLTAATLVHGPVTFTGHFKLLALADIADCSPELLGRGRLGFPRGSDRFDFLRTFGFPISGKPGIDSVHSPNTLCHGGYLLLSPSFSK